MNVLIVILAYIFIVHEADASIFGRDPWQWSSTADANVKQTNTKSGTTKTEKKSLFEVDPKSIVRLICSYGGILLPKDVERDLNIVSSVCDCDEAWLDFFDKKLLLKNFTVSMPSRVFTRGDEYPALRVGQIAIRWDSYLKPCIDIEVDNVDILIEFVNIILSRNNWNELKDKGFPPDLSVVPDNSDTQKNESSSVRIGSISTTGEVRLRVRSRPLDKDLIPIIIFNLSLAKIINKEIERSSRRAEKETGRRGCTFDEVDHIIQNFFALLIQELLQNAALDATSVARTVTDAKKVLNGAKDAAVKYVKSVGDKTEEQFDESLRQLGISNTDAAKDIFIRSARSIFGKSKGQPQY